MTDFAEKYLVINSASQASLSHIHQQLLCCCFSSALTGMSQLVWSCDSCRFLLLKEFRDVSTTNTGSAHSTCQSALGQFTCCTSVSSSFSGLINCSGTCWFYRWIIVPTVRSHASLLQSQTGLQTSIPNSHWAHPYMCGQSTDRKEMRRRWGRRLHPGATFNKCHGQNIVTSSASFQHHVAKKSTQRQQEVSPLRYILHHISGSPI